MKSRISQAVRQAVAERAGFRCEYCFIRESDMFLSFEVDHIVSQKHGGGSELENLAYACPHCNQHKGSDLTTVLDSYDDVVSLFNPRKDIWHEHFSNVDGEIVSHSRVGQATVKLLQFNAPDRLLHRQILSKQGDYP